MNAPPCDICRAMKEMRGVEPPCGECRVEPVEENREAYAVWEYVSDQVVTVGMGEVVGVDFNAVRIALEVMGIEEWEKCFEKVVAIAREVIRLRREKRDQPG